MLEELLERLRGHDRLALSRLLSMASRGEHVEEILARLPVHAQARVVAITGSAGVGKSTLIGRLIQTIRGAGLSVAVLACDPQSPLSGGALLGDRFRMSTAPDDDGTFIRSLATPGGHGAVVEHVEALTRIVESFGFDVVIIETVGAGQGDTAVQNVADVVVLLLQPETGDDLQWEKAGVLEIADIIAVHKADLAGAERVESQVRSALGLAPGRDVTITRVSSKTGEGLKELWEAIAHHPLGRCRQSMEHADLVRLAQEALGERFAARMADGDSTLEQFLADWREARIAPADAGRKLFEILASKETPPR